MNVNLGYLTGTHSGAYKDPASHGNYGTYTALAKQSQSAQKSTGQNKDNQGTVINIFDTYIKKELSKDQNLPELKSITKSSEVLSAIRKSKKISKDKDTVSNLKAVLSVRQQLSNYKPGSVVNGR